MLDSDVFWSAVGLVSMATVVIASGVIEPPTPHMTPNTNTLLKKTVLLVDDEPNIREMMGKMLLAWGFHIIQASNGKEATTRYKEDKSRIVLVICDRNMPDMNGEEFFEFVHADNPRTAFIMISAQLENSVKKTLLNSGVYAILDKPFSMAKLLSAVQGASTRFTDS